MLHSARKSGYVVTLMPMNAGAGPGSGVEQGLAAEQGGQASGVRAHAG